MKYDLSVSVPVVQTGRTLQLSGLFDLPPQQRSERKWSVNLPLEGVDWNVGLIVGPSGSGKSTLARQAFGDVLVSGHSWPADRSLVDAFPEAMGINDITGALSAVGFSSPPAWLRPYHALSNGEQFRVTLARALAEAGDVICFDEFTSVVDRTVAQVGSAAVAKAVRRSKKKFVAVTCHFDVEEWLDPDWVVVMPEGTFTRRLLRRRPEITLEVCRVRAKGWPLFEPHHYLSASHSQSARCFCAFWGERPVAWCSVIPFPHAVRPGYNEHRMVCLPDFQGVGIGSALSDFIAGCYACTGKPYRGTTSHPGHIAHRLRSGAWKCTRRGLITANKARSRACGRLAQSTTRATASFEYIGPRLKDQARALGIIA